MDDNLIVTCGKSHINFWTVDSNTLVKKQGLFEVMIATVSRLPLGCIRIDFCAWVHRSVETREAKVCVVCGVC